MSLNANSAPLVKEYLQVAKQLEPLLARQEVLKVQVRDLGPGTYAAPKLGIVKVSAASESKLKGTEFKLTEKFSTLSLKERTALQAKGVIKLENIYSRASASKVEAVLAA